MVCLCSRPVPHEHELVLPGGKIQFVISLASDHLTDCTPDGDMPAPPALLVGARTSAELIATRDMKQLAGVVFRPGGLGPWLRERADLFYEQSHRSPICGRQRACANGCAIRSLRTSRCEIWTRRCASKLRRANGESMFAER